MKQLLLIICAIFLSACPANPKRINVSNGNEQHLDCQQLAYEIHAAKQAKIAAHEQDHFRFSDMFPPTGIMSVINIWRADGNAQKRIELLNKIAKQKYCM